MTEKTITDWRALLAGSHTALRAAVAGVPADAWVAPTPCAQWSVTQAFQHATGDQIGYAAAITGGPWPAEDPFAPSGHLAEDPLVVTDHALATSAAAFATVDDNAEAVPVPLPQGPLPAWQAAGACALDAAVHAWDIALATRPAVPADRGAGRAADAGRHRHRRTAAGVRRLCRRARAAARR